MGNALKPSSKVVALVIICLSGIIVFPTLPLKFTLQQLAISILGCISLIMAVYVSIIMFSKKASENKHLNRDRVDGIECLLIIILAYLVLQIVPFPRAVIETLSPAMSGIWQVDAYELKGKAVLTADISGTIWFLITWCGYFFLFILLSRLISRNWHFVLITLTLFLIGLYQVIFDEVTKYLGYEYITAGQTDGHSYRMTGTFVNSNNLSALLNLSIAAGLTLAIYLKSIYTGKNTLILFLALGLIGVGELVLVYGLIKAGSAGGLLALVLSVFLVALILIMRQFSLKVLTGLFLFIVVMALILTFYGSRELNISQLSGNLSLSGRPILWLSIIDMWKDFAVFGIGAGAFEWTFPMYKSDAVTPLRVFTAHSGYLHLAVETGLLGVVLGLLFGLLFFRKVLAILKKSQIHLYLVSSLMIGVLAFIIHECVETNLLIPPVAILFFSLLALTKAISNLNFDKREIS